MNIEGEWMTTVTVKRGQAHTFWVDGFSSDTGVAGIDIYGEFLYKEDGETWEDCVYASESCAVENSSGGWDTYVLLTADDWDWVPANVKSVKFIVTVWGWYDDDVASNNQFIFHHSAGVAL